jgi:hypothetical protein
LAVKDTEETVLQKSTTIKLAEMNFLERSASRRGKKTPGFGGSVGVQLFEFLSNVRRILEDWLVTASQSAGPEAFDQIRSVVELWQDLVKLSSTTNLNEAVFQVYLALFDDWIKNAGPLGTEVEQALGAFREPLKLTTGLSMERIWEVKRPDVPRTLDGWEQLLKIKAIMARFDAVPVQGKLPYLNSLGMMLTMAMMKITCLRY